MVFWAVVMTICSIFHSATVQLLNHTLFPYVNMLSMVEGHKQFLGVLVLPGDPQEVKPLLCLLYCCFSVCAPGLVPFDVHVQDPEG